VDIVPRGVVLLRELRGLTQTDLGDRCNLPRSYISRIEHGHTMPSIPLLERISFALGLDLPGFFVHARNLVEQDREKQVVCEPKAA
jgi:transcriptional regulator with XRE-family HTH domain